MTTEQFLIAFGMQSLRDLPDKEQLEDFKDRGDYLAVKREFEAKGVKEASLTIKKKTLQGAGALCYEHLLGFEAPLSVKYTLKEENRALTKHEKVVVQGNKILMTGKQPKHFVFRDSDASGNGFTESGNTFTDTTP